jgi:hypothetical protein
MSKRYRPLHNQHKEEVKQVTSGEGHPLEGRAVERYILVRWGYSWVQE